MIRERATDISEHHVLNDTQSSVSVPHDATNMYILTHSIYTIFMPTHNAVGLYLKMISRAPVNLEDVWCDS